MAHSKEAHGKGAGMPYFERDHWQKNAGETEVANGKYTQGEMSNPEHLKKSVDGLANYVRKNKMQYP